jgi:hypothetical protein
MNHNGKKLVASFLVLLLVYSVLIITISQHSTTKSTAIDNKLSAMLTQKRYDVYEQLMDVNTLKGEATVRVEPWPQDPYFGDSFRSGWSPAKDVSFTIDSIIGNSPTNDNVHLFKKDIPVGAFDVTVDQLEDAHSNVSYYPYDSYEFAVPISASFTDEKGQQQDLPILPQNYTKKIDTFDVKMNRTLYSDVTRTIKATSGSTINAAVGEYSTGNASNTFIVRRSNSTKLLTFIILLLMITAITSLGVMAYLVGSGHRPPTLSALTWSALTFSLIGLRGLFPGSPPIGVMIDRIIYFPALLMTLVCSLFILLQWAGRDDFVN